MKTKDDIEKRIAEINKRTDELEKALELLISVYKNNSPSEPVRTTIDILGSLKDSLHSEAATLEWVPVRTTIDILGSLKDSLHSEAATLEWVLED